MKIMEIIKLVFGTVKGRIILGVLLGVGIASWNQPDNNVPFSFFEAIPIVAICSLMAIRVYYALQIGDAAIKKRYLHFDFPQYVYMASLLLPILWIATPVLGFADYRLPLGATLLGSIFYASGLWVCHRSHADLGTGLSPTLDIKEDHKLVSVGVYRRIRHPMYLGFLLFSIGQSLAVSNFIAGPLGFLGTVLFVVLRIPKEEGMMAEEFGNEYTNYQAKTSSVVPGLW